MADDKFTRVVLSGATVGVIGGAVVCAGGYIKGRPPLPYFLFGTLNVSLVGMMFVGLREILLENSRAPPLSITAASGFLTGFSLFGFPYGIRTGSMAGLVGGIIGGAGQFAWDSINWEKVAKNFGVEIPEDVEPKT